MAALRFHVGFCLILWTIPFLAQAADGAKVRTDAHGDPLPPGALARLGTLRFRLPQGSYSLALSPDGKLLAAGTGSGHDTVTLIDAATGLEVRQIKVNLSSAPGSLLFSPDSTRLVTFGVQGSVVHDVQVHNINTGKSIAAFHAKWRFGSSFLAISADGKRLAVGGDGVGEKVATKVWSLETMSEVASLDVLHDSNVQVALSSDGKILANWGRTLKQGVGGNQDVSSILQLWDVAKGTEFHQIKCESSMPTDVVFSPNGRQMAVLESDSSLGIWDVASGTQLRRLATRPGSGAVLRYSPAGKTLVVGTRDGVIQTWDVASGKRLDIRSGPECSLCSLVFVGHMMLAAGLKNQAVCVWEPSSGEIRSPKDQPTAPITGLAFSRDGKMLISAGENVRWWDLAAGKTIRQFTPLDHSDRSRIDPLTLHLAPEGKFLAMSRQPATGFLIRDLEKGEELCVLTIPFDNRGVGSAFAGDGKTFATQSQEYRKNVQGTVLRVWDLSSGEQTHRLDAKMSETNQLALSPDGKLAALVVNNRDLANRQQIGEVQLWDLSTGKKSVTFPMNGWTTALRFSPDGAILATGCGEDAPYLWDAVTGMRLRILEGAIAAYMHQMHFSPDGRLLAGVVSDVRGQGGSKVIVWELASGKVRAEFSGHRRAINALAFAPDSRVLATGGEDTSVLLWDLVGRIDETIRPGGKLTAKELADLWADLTGDARKGHQAMVRLTTVPEETIALLRQQVPPAAGKLPEAKLIDQLLTDLDSDSFEVREKASRALETAGKAVRPALLKAMAAKASVEKKRRVQELLDALTTAGQAPELVRPKRALEVLERLGTPEALKLVQELAGGNPDAPLTVEAERVLRRLTAQP
jgi:WD40 repeat protein